MENKDQSTESKKKGFGFKSCSIKSNVNQCEEE